ncbi:MAG: hypothetical protein U0791_20465 [Gemmataceae bacterium]
MLPLPELLRLARVLQRGGTRPAPAPDAARLWVELDGTLEATRRTHDRIRLAARHDLRETQTVLRRDWDRWIAHATAGIARLAEVHRPVAPPPDLRHWVGEVRQLEAEFGSVNIRWRDRILRAVTEPITLEGVELGPFAIEFKWDAIGPSRAFEVVALQPNPPSGRSEVVHPHVDDRHLCAGEATEPLRVALEQGRIADAFLLVQSVLVNYNSQSAYVPLRDWDGFVCAHCGTRGRSGSAGSCDSCDSELCSDCSDACASCSDPRCPGCLESCERCDNRCCRGCLSAVAGRSVCPECRTICPTCSTRIVRDDPDDDRCPACIRAANESLEPEETACVPTA